MKKNSFTFGLRALMIATTAILGFSCNNEDEMPGIDQPGMAPEVSFTALLEGNRIAMYDARELNSPMDTREITGLESGDNIISIDYRPATGQLYALGASSRLYVINENSGVATALGESSFSPAISGENASIDFNPTVDRIRLVTESGQNLRLHPELGNVVATDGNISGGSNPRIGAVAYTNSMAGASATELFDIDFASNKLYVQDPPNDGGLREIGDLGVDFMGMGNFDINPDNSVALAVTRHENESKLYTINLSSGRAQWVGTFNQPVFGIAFKTNPVAYAATEDNMLHRFNPMSPQANAVAFQGLLANETVVGLDFRPANGQLYAITSLSRIMTVNTANGQLTLVGAVLNPLLSGSTFGFDFNPTVDRIRLVSNTGQNLRLHPDLGTVVAVDGNLNPGSPMVNGAAYTNNIANATSTVLYVIDSETNMLYKQDPPNDGGLVAIGALGVDITADNGFDIGGKSNMAFALLEVGGTTAVYSINLESGAATKVADFNVNATAMAVGLGF
ncbi:DUF4394 domain-containing protein [Belliella kenyensis]|uniref:DUF4394 domain-containing protein n=1 Tax=Belliella kenyensis TaxID=1472724 RepID=A0ABV8ELS5_9BACT|nr:DUF4394 domain-containing protein [Belliella kenyensis]MCH7403164.1 DUF4394 domain-containing protein [Belliella kenyensis]MDN3604775.1 DUF4394 domain-containing protein [Belliella kenyensis]